MKLYQIDKQSDFFSKLSQMLKTSNARTNGSRAVSRELFLGSLQNMLGGFKCLKPPQGDPLPCKI